MATYYWVGGTGTWLPTDSSHWSNTSGGIANAGYPTDLDTAIFDSASSAGSYTVTLTTNLRVSIWTIGQPASGTVTFTGFTAITVSQTMTATGLVSLSGITGAITFNMPYGFMTTGTLSLNGIALTGADVVVSLPSSAKALNITSSLSCKNFMHYGGAVTLGATDITVSAYVLFYATATGSFNFSAGTINTAKGIDCSAITTDSNLTITAGTDATFGTINVTLFYSDRLFHGASYTWNNVVFASSFPSWYNSVNLSSSSTIRNLTINPPTATGYTFINLNKNLAVTNTLTVTSADPLKRFCFRSGQGANSASNTRYNAQRNLTITGATVNINECEFREVNVIGGTITGNRLGNCGGNSGVTFTAASNKYAVSAGSWASSYMWSTTPGGAASANNIPLPQDTVYITNSSFASGGTISMDSNDTMIGTLSAGGRTLPYTLSCGTSTVWSYASVVLGSCTMTSNQSLWFLSNPDSGTLNYATSNSTVASSIVCDAPAGAITFTDQFTSTANTSTAGGSIIHVRGVLNFNYTPTMPGYTTAYYTAGLSKQLNVPNGTMNLTGFSNTADSWSVNSTWTCNASPLQLNINSSVPIIMKHMYTGTFDPTGIYKINVTCTGTGNLILYGSYNNVDYSQGGTPTGAIIQIMDFAASFTGDVSIKAGVELRGNTMFLAPASGTTTTLTAANINVTGTGITVSRGSGAYTGKVKLGSNLTVGTFSVTDSVFDSNGYTLNFTSLLFGYTNTYPRTIIFSGSTWYSGTAITAFSIPYNNITFSSDGKISFRNTGTLTITPTAGVVMPKFELAGSGNVTFTGTGSYLGLSNTASGMTVTFPQFVTNTFANFSLSGANINNKVTITSNTASGAVISKTGGNIYLKYVNLNNIVGAGNADWNAYSSTKTSGTTGIKVYPLAQVPPSVCMAFM